MNMRAERTRKPYRAAIIGLGNIGWKFDAAQDLNQRNALTHAGAFSTHLETMLVGGCSPDFEDRKAFSARFKVQAFETVHRLLQETSPDVVSICSPTDLHYEHVMKCLEFDIPMIWLEKPPAVSFKEMTFLIEKTNSTGCIVLVNFQRRYCENYRNLKRIYTERLLGEPISFHLTYSLGLAANGSHMLDVLLYILGDPIGLTPFLFESGVNPTFKIETRSGLYILVSGLSVPYHCIDIELICDKGRVGIYHGGMTHRLERKKPHTFFPGFYRLQEAETDLLGKTGFDGGMSRSLSDLLESYRSSRVPTSCLKTAAESVRILEIIQGLTGVAC